MRIRWLVPFAWFHSALIAGALSAPGRVVEAALGGDPAQSLVVAVCAVLVVCGARTALAVHLTVVARTLSICGAPAPRIAAAARRIAPLALRAAVAASAAAVVASPAQTSAAQASSASPGDAPSADAPLWPVSGLWPISEPSASEDEDAGSARSDSSDRLHDDADPDTDAGAPHGGGAEEHIVASGETLWEIAAESCSDCGAEEIAARVSEIHRANAEMIGPDVDLILPGQRVVLP